MATEDEKKIADKKVADDKKAAEEKKVADDKLKKGKDDKTPDPIPYDRFKEINDENRTMAAKIKAMEDEDEERKAKEAKEAGKFEELYLDEKKKREDVERLNLRNTVALEKGLPAEFIKRLQGDNRETLEKDADDLLEMITEAGKGKKGIKDGSSKKSSAEVLDIEGMSPAEIRENKNALLEQNE